MDQIRKYPWHFLALLIFLLAAGQLLFFQLDAHALRCWDESLYATNAIEMSNNGDWIVKHFNGHPDMWNVKPPLMVWAQAISMKFLGTNELAVRLPIAACAFLTLLLLLHFSRKHLGNIMAGLLAGMVLLTLPGYVAEHGTRTGDHDVPLTLFLLTGLLYFWLYVEKEERKGRHLAVAAAGIIAASLTKGVAGLLFLPGMFLLLIYRKKLKTVLQDRRFWYAVGAFMLLVPGYYLLREMQNPGYLAKVWEHELGGRYFGALEGHGQHFTYYWEHMLAGRYLPWLYFLPLAALLVFRRGTAVVRSLCLWLGVVGLTYFLIISGGRTKLPWYDIPMMPLAALLMGIGLADVIRMVVKGLSFKVDWQKALVAFGIVYLMFSAQYNAIRDANWFRKSEPEPEEIYGYVMHAMEKMAASDPEHGESWKNFRILDKEFNPALVFYRAQALFERGVRHLQVKDAESLIVGEVVMVCMDEMADDLRAKREVRVLKQYNGCELVEILQSH